MEQEKSGSIEEMELLLDKNDQKQGWLNTLKGLTGMLVSDAACVTSFASVQLLERAIPDYELNAMRFAVAAIFYLLYLVFRRAPLKVPKDQLWVVLVYGIFVLLETMCVFIAVTFIPIAHVDALKMTSSLLFGLVLFATCLEERFTASRVAFSLLCIFGIVCVTQPDFIFMKVETTANISLNLTTLENGQITQSNTVKTVVAYCLAVVGGFGVSGYTMLSQKEGPT